MSFLANTYGCAKRTRTDKCHVLRAAQGCFGKNLMQDILCQGQNIRFDGIESMSKFNAPNAICGVKANNINLV